VPYQSKRRWSGSNPASIVNLVRRHAYNLNSCDMLKSVWFSAPEDYIPTVFIYIDNEKKNQIYT
jgi:hypothetical protein